MDYGVQLNEAYVLSSCSRWQHQPVLTFWRTRPLRRVLRKPERFEALYVKYENDPSVKRETVKAVELFSLLMQSVLLLVVSTFRTLTTGNTLAVWFWSSTCTSNPNLCLEIALPTKPLSNVEDDEGEIALCTLSAFNLSAINELDDLAELSELVVRALDALLDYQDYRFQQHVSRQWTVVL